MAFPISLPSFLARTFGNTSQTVITRGEPFDVAASAAVATSASGLTYTNIGYIIGDAGGAAASVFSFTVGRAPSGMVSVESMILSMTSSALDTAGFLNAPLMMKLYNATVTPSGGDNTNWVGNTPLGNYVGDVSFVLDQQGTTSLVGLGVPRLFNRRLITTDASQKLYGILTTQSQPVRSAVVHTFAASMQGVAL